MTKASLLLFFFIASFLCSAEAIKNGKLFLGFNTHKSPDSRFDLLAEKYNAGWVRLWETEWYPFTNPADTYVSFVNRSTVAKAKGLKVLALCHGAPPSKSGVKDPNFYVDYPPLPQYYGDFGDYCAGFVKNGADAVEIWNEPNLDGFWKPGVNLTSHYILAQLTIAAYKAIKAVNPNAIVVTGGLGAGADLNNLTDTAVAHAGLRYTERLFTVPHFNESFDAFGLHPYCFGNGWHPKTMAYRYNLWAQLPTFADILVKYAGGKPMWFTEFGAPSNYYGTTEETQRIDFQQYFADIEEWQSKNNSIGVVFIYQDVDRSEPQYASNMEGHFGIMYQNQTEKPAAVYLRQWAEKEYVSFETTSSQTTTDSTSPFNSSTTDLGSQTRTDSRLSLGLRLVTHILLTFVIVCLLL